VGLTAEFEKLLVEQIDRHGRWYCGVAYRILRDMMAAEDVCQSAFLAAWEHRDRIRDSRSLRSWLLSTVVNRSLQMCRRRKLERRYLNNCQQSAVVPMDGCEAVDFSDLFAHAVAELPEMTQAVVVLRLVEQLSGNDVKDLLNCSASEVSRRLHAGMEHLRQRLATVYMAGRQT